MEVLCHKNNVYVKVRDVLAAISETEDTIHELLPPGMKPRQATDVARSCGLNALKRVRAHILSALA